MATAQFFSSDGDIGEGPGATGPPLAGGIGGALNGDELGLCTRCNLPKSRKINRMTFAEFDALYANRHLPENLSRLEGALTDNPQSDDYGWLWRAARLDHFRAMQALDENPGAARALFSQGAERAQGAQALQGDRVEAAFWAPTCALEAARLSGTFAAATALGRAQKQLNRAAQIDETFHCAGPLRVLGRVTHLKPLLLGGSLDRALAFFERALQIAPDNSTTLLYYADALIADNQPAKARRVLKQIIAAPALESWVWESERDRELARTMMAEKLD